MATSHPEPDPSPDARETRLDTLAAQVEAIDTLIGMARERLMVFDRDLADGGWASERRAQHLSRFLRRSRDAKLQIIVHEPRYLESSCPRILALVKVYSHAMQVWRTGAEARGAQDALVIADNSHYLHRFHSDQARATLAIAMPQAAKPLCARFDEIWATGTPALGGSVLGL